MGIEHEIDEHELVTDEQLTRINEAKSFVERKAGKMANAKGKKSKKKTEPEPVEETKDPMTDRDATIVLIVESIKNLGDDLTRRAIRSVEEHGQEASFAINVKLEPTGTGVEVTRSGKLTVGTGKLQGTLSLDDSQLRMDADPDGEPMPTPKELPAGDQNQAEIDADFEESEAAD
jgi:hypothetical protein